MKEQTKREKIFEKITEIIAFQLNIEQKRIDEENHLYDNLGIDSLDQIELIMAFEEAFDLNITDEEAGKVRIVKDIIDGIFEKTE